MPEPPRLSIVAARGAERPVTLRLPFRFGNATLTSAIQAFVEVRVRMQDGLDATGVAAELMVPRWFDKSPSRSITDNVDDLRASTLDACQAYTCDASMATAFGHTARHHAQLMRAQGRTALSCAFGPALVDRAVIDALCTVCGASFAHALARNLVGLDSTLAADLAAFDIDGWLASRRMPETIAIRHTVGLVDPIAGGADIGDALPVTLEQAIERYGHRHFKVKIAGDVDADIPRLAEVARALDRLPRYCVTLDGNEQFADARHVEAFVERLRHEPALRRFAAAVAYLEQPLRRGDASAMRIDMPLLLDEGDDDYDAWPRAAAAGYAGVSSKGCKGIYKSIINAMRCRVHGGFVSGEDLTTQCGTAVQQDLALAAMLGVEHVERNGQHYVDGFAGAGAPPAERAAFVSAHADLYDAGADNAHLRIAAGCVSLRSLGCVGFACAARPDLDQMAPMRVAQREIAEQ